MSRPESGPNPEINKEQIYGLLAQIKERVRLCKNGDILQRKAQELESLLRDLPAEVMLEEKTTLSVEPEEEKERGQEYVPPVKSLAEVAAIWEADRSKQILMEDGVLAVPFPTEKPKGYYIIPRPGTEEYHALGLWKFYPDMKSNIPRDQYEIIQAAWVNLEKEKNIRDMNRINQFDIMAWVKTGKARKIN